MDGCICSFLRPSAVNESSKTERKERKGEKEKRGEEGREAERRLLVAGGWPGVAGRRRSSGGAEQDGEEKAEGEKRRGERRGQRDLGLPARSSVGGSRNGCVAFVTVALPKP